MRALLPGSIAAVALALAGPAQAQFVQPNFVDLTFTGTVTQSLNDTITVRNPDGSTVNFSGDQVPDYRYRTGDALTTTFRFDANQPSFSNPACSGGVALTFVPDSVGPGSCRAQVGRITTPFEGAGFGGTGGDSPPFLNGLRVVRDPDTGRFSVAAPTGSYNFGYVGVNPLQYDSRTQTLSGPTSFPCVNTFDCLGSIANGTLTSMFFPVDIAGDFGLVRPGFNVGYLAGRAGGVTVSGGFSFSGQDPIDVPEPGMIGLFGLGAAAVTFRRRRQSAAAA
jgi:hypothetical protein